MTDQKTINCLMDIISNHYTCFKDDEREALYNAIYNMKGKQEVIKELNIGIDPAPDDEFDQGTNFGIAYALKVIDMYTGEKNNEF